MARWARDEGVILRFIEYMDVGHTNGWRLDEVVPAGELVATVDAEMPIEAVPPRYRGEVADSLAVPRREWRGRPDRVGHRAVLRRLHAGAPVGRGPLLHVPVHRGGPRPARDPPRSGRVRRRPGRGAVAAVWRVRDDRYSEERTEATSRACPGSRCSRWAVDDPRQAFVHTFVHSRRELVDTLSRPQPQFVDKCVDPSPAAPYRRSCPKGPSGTGETEITSRASAPRRSLRALRCPDPAASAVPVRAMTARRNATGIPVSVRPSGPRSRGPRGRLPPGRVSGGPHARDDPDGCRPRRPGPPDLARRAAGPARRARGGRPGPIRPRPGGRDRPRLRARRSRRRPRGRVAIPFAELPGWPAATAPGHVGRLLLGRLGGTPVVMLQGRFHLYEGNDPGLVVQPVLLFRRLGAKVVVLTNAAGGVDPASDRGR